ncbi:MAG: AAA family ATPase [Ktedonobacteraceae bacterium]
MLLELSIKDFAIIDSLHLRLNRLFNVFTGETGAGKSIIIDAVNALLGGKIGADFVRAGSERASVEGIFTIHPLPPIKGDWQPFEFTLNHGSNGAKTLLEAFDQAEAQINSSVADAESADAAVALATLLHQYDITPEDDQLILARDIFRSGRTVSRINGRAVSQQVLQQVASWLVDIHGQSEHMSLLRPEQHVNFLDRYVELIPLRNELGVRVTDWRNARKQLLELQQSERDVSRRTEFLRFEIDEIEQAELQPG